LNRCDSYADSYFAVIFFIFEEMSSAAVSACQQSQRYHHIRLDSLLRPQRRDDETLAQYEWRFLRIALKQAVQLAVEFEENDLTITHGMHFFRRILHDKAILQVFYRKSMEVCILISAIRFWCATAKSEMLK